ncbi:hypothetical protein BKA93DRAFT_877255 [Sparassis latifolia]
MRNSSPANALAECAQNCASSTWQISRCSLPAPLGFEAETRNGCLSENRLMSCGNSTAGLDELCLLNEHYTVCPAHTVANAIPSPPSSNAMNLSLVSPSKLIAQTNLRPFLRTQTPADVVKAPTASQASTSTKAHVSLERQLLAAQSAYTELCERDRMMPFLQIQETKILYLRDSLEWMH